MHRPILRLARKVKRTVRSVNQRPVSESITVEKVGRSSDSMRDFIKSASAIQRSRALPQLNPAIQRSEQLKQLLSGEIRETSFRHKVQNMDAGEVLAAVSSPTVGLDLIYLGAKAAPPGWRLELGSAFGVGTVALCTAENETDNPVDGVEFEAWRAEIANQGAQAIIGSRVNVHAGAIEDVVPTLTSDRPKVGFAFVDAKHTHEATMGYHHLLREHAQPGTLALYDDLGWSSEMEQAWRDIVNDNAVTDALRIDRRWGLVSFA